MKREISLIYNGRVVVKRYALTLQKTVATINKLVKTYALDKGHKNECYIEVRWVEHARSKATR